MNRRIFAKLGLVALSPLAGGLFPASALAQVADSFPTRPIRLVMPYAPGGPGDIFSRAVGRGITQRLGQPVVVDSRPGAGGVLGLEIVAKSVPDGYTIGLGGTGSLAGALSLMQQTPYDPLKDFAAISMIATVPEILAVHPGVRATTVAELVALAKEQPGSLSYGSGGMGTGPHLAGELLRLRTGIDIVHVPYRGAAPATTDLVSGQIQLMIGEGPTMMPFVQAGNLRALAVTTRSRLAALPDVPTLTEAGVPDIEMENWYCLLAPAATPPARLALLRRVVVETLNDQEVQRLFAAQGASPAPGTPEALMAHIQREITRWAEVSAAAGSRTN
ncbi:tripartite-type tricarboxylate transporter receptor subunit TctC [Humitalea rosea]|uniref:Tripartite-type tricarboxylate transporter receptor subunit TctC n=1 Tax=Humitalea rosea TaxID=990373 RepID=A0A2W7I8M4_9PROT|nr:tripartite tricarboxylate transporter substrate binding protein [Humitalea rosea]PZW41872.1 tripartite-type tricarboxylate transporter receptor subunit TctC [Humitalea rosea]